MNKFKEYMLKFTSRFFFLFGLISSATGIYIANIVAGQFKSVPDGVLGLTVIYLLYLVFLSPRRIIWESNEGDTKFPEDLKLLPYAFFFGMILFWSGDKVVVLFRSIYIYFFMH